MRDLTQGVINSLMVEAAIAGDHQMVEICQIASDETLSSFRREAAMRYIRDALESRRASRA